MNILGAALLLAVSASAFSSPRAGSNIKWSGGRWQQNSELRATNTQATNLFRFPSDQDQVDINRADMKDTWTPADIQQYKAPARLGNIAPKQFIPSPGQKYGRPTMAQTDEEILDQIGALATKVPAFLPTESRNKEYLILNDPRFGPKYPPWIQSC